jgi:hypothetical protein
LDYYIFLQLEASKSSPIDEKSANLVPLLTTLSMGKGLIVQNPEEWNN